VPAARGGFASRADTACAAAGAKILALPAPVPATVLPDLRSSRTILIALTGQLRAIKAPPAKAKLYGAFVASVGQHAAILGQIMTAVTARQSSKIGPLGRAAETVAKRTSLDAKALGLTACAKRYSPSGTPSTGTPTTPPTIVPVPMLVPAAPPAAPAPAVASVGVSAGHPSQTGTQTFEGTSSSGQTINTSGGGFFTAG